MELDPPLPGQTPIDDISGLKPDISTQAELNACEAENIRQATLKYIAKQPSPKQAPFDLAWILRLHQEMFGQVWDWAGTVRQIELNLGSPAYRIQIDLQTLLDDLLAWKSSDMQVLEQSVRLHHRAVKIHPFLNGNGRWSRLLSNVWLKRHSAQPVIWPETTIGTSSSIRDEYIAAVKAADDFDYGPLIELHERYGSAL